MSNRKSADEVDVDIEGSFEAEHGLKSTINDMIDYIPMAVPLLVGAIQVHCEQIAEQAEAIRMAEAESAAKGKVSFFNVDAMIRDADVMLKHLHKPRDE